MRSDNMALYRDLTLYNFVYILLDYPTLFYDLLGEIRYDYSSSVNTVAMNTDMVSATIPGSTTFSNICNLCTFVQ